MNVKKSLEEIEQINYFFYCGEIFKLSDFPKRKVYKEEHNLSIHYVLLGCQREYNPNEWYVILKNGRICAGVFYILDAAYKALEYIVRNEYKLLNEE